MDTQTEPQTADQLVAQIEQETKTEAERLAVHQERRSEIGRRMKLDVGIPGERAILANGQESDVRDYIGMALDPLLYVNRKCNKCLARGTETIVKYLTPAQAKKAIADDPKNELFISEREPGKFEYRELRSCICSKRRYKKAHALFADALVKAELAKWAGVIIDGDGDRMDRVELL